MRASPIATSACCTPPPGRGTRMISVAPNASRRKSSRRGASETTRYGTSAWWTARAPPSAGAAPVLASSSARSCSANASRGRLSRCAATRKSGTRSRSAGESAGSSPESMALTQPSRRSIRSRSDILVPRPAAQRLESPELQLLDRALTASERRRDLADRPLLREPHADHALLVRRQLRDQPLNGRGALRLRVVRRLGRIRLLVGIRVGQLAAGAPPAVRDRVRGDPEQPRRERNPLPLVRSDPGQRPVKDLTRDVLRDVAARDAPCDVGVHALEMPLVELAEAGGVPLGGLHEPPLVRLGVRSRHDRLTRLILPSPLTPRRAEGYGVARNGRLMQGTAPTRRVARRTRAGACAWP